MAATFVNAFVNAGFGQVCIKLYLGSLQEENFHIFLLSGLLWCSFLSVQDKLMTVPSEPSSGGSSSSWLFKNKEHGKASAAASLVCTCTICCIFF